MKRLLTAAIGTPVILAAVFLLKGWWFFAVMVLIMEGAIWEYVEIGRYLYTSGQPDPDLMIRTSGELRVSNFLLWQIAYSEIWVTNTLWPDFRRRDLYEAILDYQRRERRYGGVTTAEPEDVFASGRLQG